MLVQIPARRSTMGLDLDTFLTALYTTVDDLYQERIKVKFPQRPGPKPALTDSEVLTLAFLAQWRPFPSERAYWRWERLMYEKVPVMI